MKSKTLYRVFLVLAMLGVIFGAAGMVSPAFAQDNDPVPLPDPGNNGDVIIVPETGSNNDPGLFSGWTLLIILGVVVVVLLIVLVARGTRY